MKRKKKVFGSSASKWTFTTVNISNCLHEECCSSPEGWHVLLCWVLNELSEPVPLHFLLLTYNFVIPFTDQKQVVKPENICNDQNFFFHFFNFIFVVSSSSCFIKHFRYFYFDFLFLHIVYYYYYYCFSVLIFNGCTFIKMLYFWLDPTSTRNDCCQYWVHVAHRLVLNLWCSDSQ